MITAYSYIRFSSMRQLDGDTLRRQLAWGPEVCQRNRWRLDSSLTMQDLGVSAFTGKNATEGNLGAFLEAIKQGRVKPGSVLLLEALDRLTRMNIDDGWELFRSILKTGVEIVTREPERQYILADLKKFSTRIEVMAYMERANNESEVKSLRGRSHWQHARQDANKGNGPIHGKRSGCPAWLELSDDNKRFLVVPHAARTIKKIYKWAEEGFGIVAILARLNKERVQPFGRNKTWARSYVNKLLTTKAVIGEYQPNTLKDGKLVPVGEPIAGYFPAVISEDEWYRVRKGMAARGKSRGRRGHNVANLFSSLVRDARDGSCFVMDSSTKSRKFLISMGAINKEPGSLRLAFPYEPFEQAFLQFTKELKASDILGTSDNGQQAEIEALAGKLADLEAKIETVQARVMAESTIDSLVSVLEKLDAERKATAKKREYLQAQFSEEQPTAALGDIQSLSGLLAKAAGEERTAMRTRIKARIRQLVSDIWMMVYDATPAIRVADIQIMFGGGKVKSMLLAWKRTAKKQDIVIGGGNVLQPGPQTSRQAKKWRRSLGVSDAHGEPIPLLADYRMAGPTKAWLDARHETLKPAIEKAIGAESAYRKARAALGKVVMETD